jgi:GAF domain-containing protein
MLNIRRTSPGLTPDSNVLTRIRVRLIQIFAVFVLLASALGLAASLAVMQALTAYGIIALVSIVGLDLLALYFIYQRRIQLATLYLLGALILATLIIPQAYLLLVVITVIAAAILAPTILYIVTNLVVLADLGIKIANYFAELQASANFASVNFELILLFITLVITSLATRYLVNTAERAIDNSDRSTRLLQATVDIGHATSKLLSLNDLLNEAVELVRDRFAYYHVQVFLVDDERQYADLVASTGEAGQRLLQRKHRIQVGSQSVVGRATQIGEPVLSGDTSRDVLHSPNELLPNTRSELALPILDGDRIIGALDVQSTRPEAFATGDVQALQVMANQLGASIRNARLFEQQADSLQENKRLFFESEANLREIQRLNRQLTKSAWENYLKEQATGHAVALTKGGITREVEWSPGMIQASQKRRSITEAAGDSKVIAVPIVLRGEVLGAIEIEPSEDVREADTVEMIQAVAQRLAVSLDRARLFEEAQENTAYEQRINDIVARYQTAGTLDDLLRITLTELSETLGAERGMIRLGNLQPHQNGENAS